jgi:hypothetical protein
VSPAAPAADKVVTLALARVPAEYQGLSADWLRAVARGEVLRLPEHDLVELLWWLQRRRGGAQ